MVQQILSVFAAPDYAATSGPIEVA